MPSASSLSVFDVEELKYLALKAMRTDRDEDAIRLLKDAMARAPKSGELLYLLGMAHSNLGMTDRAIEEITQALAWAPSNRAETENRP
jgi:Flp pilus assembly protein TadD